MWSTRDDAREPADDVKEATEISVDPDASTVELDHEVR